MQAALPKNELERLNALNEYQILDTLPEQAYDDITQLAAYLCKTPVALVSLVDTSRQWFKSKVGLAVSETPRKDAFCAHALLQAEDILLVGDTLNDPRFADNRLVVGEPYIRFYAGVPLLTKSQLALGTLCVIDTQPRLLDAAAKSALASLARQVMAQLEWRKSVFALQQSERELSHLKQQLSEQTATDAITPLYNRRSVEHRLVAEWERAFRYSQPLSVLMLEVDGFTAYAMQFGVAAGDVALNLVAKIMLREARQPDFVARYEGAKFVIVLAETNSEGAMKIAERIRYKIEQAAWPHYPITVSGGLASYGSQADAEALLDQATQAMYLAQQAGRNCVMAAD